jgi:hypothetical protein
MKTDSMSLASSAKTVAATGRGRARGFGAWAALAILGATASGALLAQAPQAVGTWTPVGPMAAPLADGAVVALPDDRTLVLGGTLDGGVLSDAATLYDPATNAVSAAGTLASPRTGHTATLLRDGRVLVAGGMTTEGVVSSQIEVFDLASGTSSVIALLPEPRSGHAAAALLDGTVLIAGGVTVDGAILRSAVIVDPATAAIASVAGQLHAARAHASATTLLDGRVLVAGGTNGTANLVSAEIYDPYLRSFAVSATRMSVGRQGHSAVLLPHNGSVLVAGGTSNGVAQAGADLFLPAVFPDPFSYGEGEFVGTGAMAAARARVVAGPTHVEGYAFASAAGSADREIYRFATVRTDKDDYAPGELALITGSGWQPNEDVTLLFQEDPAVHDDYVLTVRADDDGNIHWNQWAPDQHDFGVRFYLTASGSRSRAQTTFTDGNKVSFSLSANGPEITTFGSVSANQCVNAFVQERQGGNLDTDGHGARTVTLTSTPGGASFFTGPNCVAAASTSTVTIAPDGVSAAFSFRIAPGSATSYVINGNGGLSGGNNASASVTVAQDTTQPTVTISSPVGDPTNAASFAVSVTFSEAVTGFGASGLTIGNGVAGPVSGSGALYSFTLTPSGDGLVTVDIAQNVAQDAAGNGNLAAATFSRTSDRTAPSITAQRTPAANAFGWNNTDVTASYTASDALSGLDASSPATGSFTFTAEGSGQSHTFTVTDRAGNTATATVGSVNIDRTAPVVSAAVAPAANAQGWHNTDVTVTFSGSDGLSGIDACQAPSVLSTEGAGQSASGGCTDKAGNTASATASGINIDKTAPTISTSRAPAANAAGWNNTDVVASYTASDALAGLAADSPADGTHTFTAEGAAQSHTFTVTDQAGNSAQATVGGVNIDKTPPAVGAAAAPAANAHGWNNTDVTVTFSATDALSGVADCQAPTVLSSEGAGQSASGSCTDQAGNTAQATASGINIDKTAPSISADRTPAANAFGWNNTDVTASYTASDTLAGLAADSPATGTFTFSSQGAGQSHTFTVTDKAGNTATATIGSVNIDKTAPSVSATVAPPANVHGWHNTDVTVTFAGTDGLSGIDTCQTATVLSAEGAGQQASGSCTDKAGNTASATASGISIDKTAPTISTSRTPAANAAGWNNTNVTASYTAADALSDLASPATGSYVFSAEGMALAHTFTVSDKAGNTASATVGGVNIDKTAPTVVAVVEPNPVILNGAATATATATDTLSGVQAQSCPSVDTSAVGAKTLTCSAIDNAGNIGIGVAQYSVLYAWTGFLQPINDTAHQIGTTQSKFKAGQTVPAKFLLRDADGNVVQQTGNPGFLRSGNLGACATYATPEEVEVLSPDVVPVFKWDGAQYHFNWSTKGLSSGVYRISAKLDDGTQPWVDICLTK